MEISIDISMYPLQAEYEREIAAFIDLLEKEMFSVFTEIPHSIFVLKFVGNNRRGIY